MAKLKGEIDIDPKEIEDFNPSDFIQTAPVDSTEPTIEPVEENPEQQTTIGTPPLDSPGNMTKEEIDEKKEKLSTPGGFIKETLKDTGKGLVKDVERASAVGVGLLDTMTDFINFASAGDRYDIPKVPEYEDKATEALRDISGLILPTLGIKGAVAQAAGKAQAAGMGPVWLRKLGNSKSFEFISKWGLDVGAGGLVDYVAKQNQEDDNLVGTLKKYWPKTYQWIPDRYATNDSDSPEQKRMKNVNEGAIFSMMSSVVEGFAYITKAERSVARVSKYIGSSEASTKRLNGLVKDEFTDIKFSDNPVEDSILRNYARKEKELDLLAARYETPPNEPTVGIHDVFDEGDTLVRAKDQDGVIGAAADAAQIQNNIETSWGRLGNIIHEASRQNGLKLENLTQRTLVQEVADSLRKAGRFSKKLSSGKHVTEKMIDDAGKHLAATLLHPKVEPQHILGILDEFKRSIDGSAARIVGKKGINRAVKQLTQQLIDLDTHKARAYLLTSEAGQISDMAEGARLMEGGNSVERTVELMADRLELLMVEKGLANFEANSLLKNMETWKQAAASGDKQWMETTAGAILDNHSAKLLEIIPDAKRWSNTLKETARENPSFLQPLLLASEMADGDIDTLYKLHKFAGSDSFGVFNKAFVDFNPKVPSIVNQAWWGNTFNSWLSSVGTPAKAAVGNLTGLIGKGTATLAGHAVQGDLPRMKQAMTAFFALDDTLEKAFGYMRLVFRKVSSNPHEFKYLSRKDIALKEVKGMEVLESYAKASEAKGEFGPSMIKQIYQDLEDLGADPALRFSSNGMTAFDGFTKSYNSSVTAKYRALWKIQREGGEINEKTFRTAVAEIEKEMFDDNGLITDSAVDAATREIALNVDTPMAEAMNFLLKHFPALKSVVLFPRTQGAVIKAFGDWSPAGIFAIDHHRLWGIAGEKKLADFKIDEIQEILAGKGIPMDENYMEEFVRLRAEVKGKAAIGALFTTTAGFSAIKGYCTGNGHYDPAVQRQRINRGWKAKTCRVPGTKKRVSYEWMGPIGDWLAFTIDVVDNADTLGASGTEDLLNKAAFIFSASLGSKQNLAAFEPLHDIFQGNGNAMARWSSNFANNIIPLGGFRRDVSKILDDGLRELTTEFEDQLRNRNNFLDAFDPANALPYKVNYMDGKRIGYNENWWARMNNAWNPIKVHDEIGVEDQWLVDIEYNSSPKMKISNGGAVLHPHEITAINTRMGEMGNFNKDIRNIMRRANNLKHEFPDGHTAVGFDNIVKYARRQGIASSVLDHTKYKGIFKQINKAYTKAKRAAEKSLPMEISIGIRQREIEASTHDRLNAKGDIDTLNRLSYPDLKETINLAN